MGRISVKWGEAEREKQWMLDPSEDVTVSLIALAKMEGREIREAEPGVEYIKARHLVENGWGGPFHLVSNPNNTDPEKQTPLSLEYWAPELYSHGITNSRLAGACHSTGIKYARVMNGWQRRGRGSYEPAPDGICVSVLHMRPLREYLIKEWSEEHPILKSLERY
tara:strand:+ start:493 stop:987 length:495 start_codon:yes stop_codon:yes gene_type:complete